ncbi:hypothetical protein ACFYV7_25710 [Nocardia suismassiliense]|uniref:Uncharacterized protein n=1 Tax=Nocardia suismassiliense TaxID=2077092 RepID=A0ABW6QYA1_9NOCA
MVVIAAAAVNDELAVEVIVIATPAINDESAAEGSLHPPWMMRQLPGGRDRWACCQ